MPNFLTGYRASIHGFRFGNRFRHHVMLGLSTWGRCNGMTQVSLDYFNAGRPAPTFSVVRYDTNPVSGLGAASWGPDHAEIFVRRDGNYVASKRFDGRGFTDWKDVAATETTLSPSAASWGPGRIDLVVRGTGASLLHKWFDGGNWDGGGGGPCSPLPGFNDDQGGQLHSAPAVAAPFPNRVEIYVKGRDGNLWFKYYDGAWRGWSSLSRPPGLEITSDPSAAAQYGWMTALVRGSDNAVWQKEWARGGWQPWRSLGGFVTSAPAVASPYPGRLEAYARGGDGQMYLCIHEHGRWGGWSSLGAPPPGLSEDRPAAVAHYGVLDVYARANDGTVWHRRWTGGGWRPWETTELAVGGDAQRLTDAIYHRLMGTTINPIIATAVLGPIALPFLGSIRNFITLRPHSNAQLFQWASRDEMQKLTDFFRGGRPVPLSLLDSGGGFGHEVVAYGGDINVGGRSVVRVYDPNYPGCDDATITLDPAAGTITSSSGEGWRALWLRDDYRAEAPPV